MAGQEGLLLALILGFSILGLAASYILARWVLAQDTGNDAMRAVSDAIKEGAEAFMRRQFRTIIALAAVLAVVLFLGYAFLKPHSSTDALGAASLATWVTISFIFGAAC